MRNTGLLIFLMLLPLSLLAQHKVNMRNLWARPQVHVLFSGYEVSFTIRDINKALRVLAANGDSSYSHYCQLDTAGDYYCELYPGIHTEYKRPIQILLQRGVGVYLLNAGLAQVKGRKKERVDNIICDMEPVEEGAPFTFASFYDGDNHQMLFNGRINTAIIGVDPGIDD